MRVDLALERFNLGDHEQLFLFVKPMLDPCVVGRARKVEQARFAETGANGLADGFEPENRQQDQTAPSSDRSAAS
mgnify:CR=1 FL=1